MHGTGTDVSITTWGGLVTLASPDSLPEGASPRNQDIDFLVGSFKQRAGLTSAFTYQTTPTPANLNYIGTFTNQDSSIRNLALDSLGNLYYEDTTNNPGVFVSVLQGITPNSFAVGVNGEGVEYLAFNDLTTGSDIPRQYTPNWVDRISQVGPGAAPVFTPVSSSTDSFSIVSITQPAPGTFGSSFAHGLQSTGPGSRSPGNVVTQYYADATTTSGDPALIAAFNSGNAVYLHVTNTPSSGGDTVGSIQSPIVALVTSIGIAVPPANSRQFYYFTYQVANSQYAWNPGQEGYTVSYQQSLATLTTAVPVPNVVVGSQIVVTGSSVAAWDSTWTVTQTPNSGSIAITQTSLTAGVATYSYTVVSGANPTAGQLVTITGTLNADGALNVVNTPIASVTGTSAGTFTIINFQAATNFAAQAEQGQAITAGTIFDFDPGAGLVGSSTNPIFGNGTGGSLVFNSTGQFISPGTYEGVCGFITRNGYHTAPSPFVTFTVPANTTSLQVTQLPLGPPNVVGRYIGITEAGQNGVPGANFFVIPVPVNYIVNGVTYTAMATVVNDNVSTSTSLFFSNDVLLNAEAIDVQGNNLFNLIELGNPGWIVQYDSRNFYGLCQNKIQNFNNLSFDGGYLPSGQLIPLGWAAPDIYGKLLVSPIFGNSYYIQNTSGSTISVRAGQIIQPAYQDIYQQPIINPNTLYSARVTARIPSGNTNGQLDIELASTGVVQGAFVLPFSSMTSNFATYTGTILNRQFSTVPTSLQLLVLASNIGAGADVEIDRIEIFPTEIPVLTTTVFGSYADDFESVDAITGTVKFISENQEPVNGAVVMYDTFYGLKGWQGKNPGASMYSLRSQPNLEPAQWDEPEVAQKAGACGINAYDFGEQWIVEACRNGLYLYEGGQPGKIMQEIFQVWDAINWSAANSICVRNDVVHRRLFVAVPMSTPNFWLPNAPVNTNPTSPNVILMLNYQALDTAQEIKSAPQMHTTMFGTLNAIDMRRKWTLWTVATPYIGVGAGATDEQIYICNGVENSKIYILDETSQTDDGEVVIPYSYTTAAFSGASKALMSTGVGLSRLRWGYMNMTCTIGGTMNVTLLGETLLGPNDSTDRYLTLTIPGGFQVPTTGPLGRDRYASLNFCATRTFVKFSGGALDMSAFTMKAKPDTWNRYLGEK